MKVKKSLVIPVYNASDEISLIRNDVNYLIKKYSNNIEIIFVCDGCKDNSKELLQRYFGSNEQVIIIDYKINKGKGFALRAGFSKCKGEVVVFTDVDFSYSASEIVKMFDRLDFGEKLVLVNRRDAQSTFLISPPLFRYIFIRHYYSNLFNKFVNFILKLDCPDTQSGLKGFHLNEYKKIENNLNQNGFAFDIELILLFKKIGILSSSFPVHWSYREEKSKVALLKDGFKMIYVVLKLRRKI
tara:strand:- start:487 stop:1212 length:726 start_codon:yes stop_codon:yes gene_type:complete